MFIRATENFKPGDPATHIKFNQGENLHGKILVILTPDDQRVPYSPQDHNDATQANGIRKGFTIISMTCKAYYTKALDQRILQKDSQNPTQEKIASFFSLSENDAYVAVGFDSSKGDANTKWDAKLGHSKKTEILVLKEKILCVGYEPYIPSKHGTNQNNFKSVTANNFRVAQLRAKKRWLGENNSTIDASNLLPQIPTQREIDILFLSEIDAYVAKGFDPSKGDANEKYNTPKYYRGDQILVLKKKLFGSGYEPYIPSQHGTNQNDFKSIKVDAFIKARSRARVAYELWKNNNIVLPSATTSTTTTTTSHSTSNQVVGPKRFNPLLLINDYESISETKEYETEAASQSGSTSQQRKRTAEDSVLNSTPYFIGSTHTLFRENVKPASKDPTQPKRFRPWE